MLNKIRRVVTRTASKVITKTIKKKKRKRPQSRPPSPSPSPTSSPSSSSSQLPADPSTMHHHHGDSPFLFPSTNSTVLPDPSRFFAPDLLAAPLPTNSFFQNFSLKDGNQPEYIHPYLIQSRDAALTLCYPTRFHSPAFIYQTFVADITVSALPAPSPAPPHVISAFDDLSVTLDIPPGLRFHLVRGSPFVTCSTLRSYHGGIALTSVHAFLSVTSNPAKTKHRFELNSGQTFLCYSSAPLDFAQPSTTRLESAAAFSGVLRIAALIDPAHEPVLDRYSTCYPLSGAARFKGPFQLEYEWEKKGWGGDLLLLAHPLHLRLLDRKGVQVIDGFKYRSIDGDLVGVVGDSWTLSADPVPVSWHSFGGIRQEGSQELVSALRKDVQDLGSSPITTASSYFYGKAVARAARLALIAEEAGVTDVIPAVSQFLKTVIEPWLDGTFNANGFLYERKWRGFVTKQGSTDTGADFGFGIYNDHHYHLGYFLYGIAVLSKIDASWGRKYMPQAYTMVADIMTLSRKSSSSYARLRCFDLWKLHSWAGGLTEFADGRNQESTSEAVNAYYSAALLGMTYGDTHLLSVATTLTALEIAAAEMWWHVREGEGIYEEEFAQQNKVVGVLWNNKRDSGLWFAPADWREARMGIQVLPLLPITEFLFRDTAFVKDLVNWTMPALSREGVTDGWKGFVYAMEGVYDREGALQKVRTLKGHDDGNSLTNLMWWLYSRGDGHMEGHHGWKRRTSWFTHYCH